MYPKEPVTHMKECISYITENRKVLNKFAMYVYEQTLDTTL